MDCGSHGIKKVWQQGEYIVYDLDLNIETSFILDYLPLKYQATSNDGTRLPSGAQLF